MKKQNEMAEIGKKRTKLKGFEANKNLDLQLGLKQKKKVKKEKC